MRWTVTFLAIPIIARIFGLSDIATEISSVAKL